MAGHPVVHTPGALTLRIAQWQCLTPLCVTEIDTIRHATSGARYCVTSQKVHPLLPSPSVAGLPAWFKNHWLQVTLKGAKAALAKGFRVWSVTLI